MSRARVLLLSATQISLWTQCKRKWGFKYIDRVEIPTHPGALLGTEVQDTQLDPYLADGRPFDLSRPSGEIADALRPLLPAPKSEGLRLRRKFLIPSPTGQFGYQGEFDMWAADSVCVPGLEGGRPLVGDIKTTKNLDFALTSETLATDIQAQLYAMTSMYEDHVSELDLVWFYGRTRKPHRTKRVHLRVTSDQVAEQFERIDAIGAEIVGIRTASPKTQELPPNPRMCDQYGGCPYRHRCNLAPPTFAAAWNQEETMEQAKPNNDFLATLRKQTVIGMPAVQPPPVEVPKAFAPGGAFAGTQVAKAYESPPAPEALPAWATAPVDPGVHRPINPPESELPPAPPVEAKPKRTVRPKVAEAIDQVTQGGSKTIDVEEIKTIIAAVAPVMRAHGVRKLALSSPVYTIELAGES